MPFAPTVAVPSSVAPLKIVTVEPISAVHGQRRGVVGGRRCADAERWGEWRGQVDHRRAGDGAHADITAGSVAVAVKLKEPRAAPWSA